MRDKNAFSVLGLFGSSQSLIAAIPVVKERMTAQLEAYTPYPIHGIDKALGLRKSPVGGMVLVMGAIGAVSALALQMWTSGVDYPLLTAGKPYFSWEAFVPVLFESTVLFATFTAALGMLLLLNRLPMLGHPMLRSASMPHITRDKFGLAVESGGVDLDVERIAALLREAGAETIEVIERPEPAGPVSPRFVLCVLAAVAISSIFAGFLTYWGIKLFPVTVPMVHMLNQPRLDPQRYDSFFRDGFGMRIPVPGTVTSSSVPFTAENQDDARDLANPLPITGSVLSDGRLAFMNHCSVCHGTLGDGVPTLTSAYGAKPANLVSQKIIGLNDGEIYFVIMKGKNAMPSYAGDLDEGERWAVVHYVRALQRAMNAKDTDIP
jgi:mono/diheme cytochrome c family protein